MRIAYIERRFSTNSQIMIRQANEICEAYAAQGLSLTLRQLYYQFVARGLLPNRQSEYKRLGSVLNDARMAGLMDWDYLVDRTRNLASHCTFVSRRGRHCDHLADWHISVLKCGHPVCNRCMPSAIRRLTSSETEHFVTIAIRRIRREPTRAASRP